ncbi:hypothetical protein KIN20_011336 [Parelaphostrongylus tenuis]|uniref:Uncharacterized protein n=1 Tax=Parelaphostrongylus tenuis TaxID=148309 RepID=A0AAD5MUX3_PARTN|nr:hypothetical protein KIN20_011336 [Parelaphostrongylus tenuis]
MGMPKMISGFIDLGPSCLLISRFSAALRYAVTINYPFTEYTRFGQLKSVSDKTTPADFISQLKIP